VESWGVWKHGCGNAGVENSCGEKKYSFKKFFSLVFKGETLKKEQLKYFIFFYCTLKCVWIVFLCTLFFISNCFDVVECECLLPLLRSCQDKVLRRDPAPPFFDKKRRSGADIRFAKKVDISVLR
jgi:hypothetical protein